ncbi:MAG: hypothetical protein B6226_02970 [Candidatus Cloacimonetes bacterium 4572_65]|nr:MAG: hypothetical protein B6226_02970 [Candidatus Cloacimonetes bacterium 4572_65]
MSLLGAYKQVNIIVPELEVVKTWYNQNFTQTIIAKDNLLNYAKSILSNHAEFKEKVLSFLQKADSNIVNYKMDKYQLPIPTTVIENIFNTEISSKMKSKLEANPVIIREELLFEHEVEIGSKKDKFYLSNHEQSDGTMRLFGLAGIITQAIEKGSLIVIDELDSSLHPLLVEEILRNFLIESNESQLIITTHAENVLDQSGLVKECFWFVEKIEDGSSDIYPLSGFKGLSRIGSIRKSYRLGLFGATPEFSS